MLKVTTVTTIGGDWPQKNYDEPLGTFLVKTLPKLNADASDRGYLSVRSVDQQGEDFEIVLIKTYPFTR